MKLSPHHSHSGAEPQIRAGNAAAQVSTPAPSIRSQRQGASTAVEPVTPTENANDPISRYPTATADPERQNAPEHTRANDPYGLSAAYKTPAELEQIRANTSRKRDGCGPVSFTKVAAKDRKIQKFYESQNEKIDLLLKPVDNHRAEAAQAEGDNHLKYQIAVWGSLAANISLAILQLYGATSSKSLSLFTTMADAVFDPLSNITLMACNHAIKNVNPSRFPSGKARLETTGNIAFCFLMTAVSFILIAFSVQELAGDNKSSGGTKDFHLASIVAVCVAFVTKLALFFYCWSLKDTYSNINILWKDHRNDLFINGFGILTSVGGSKLKWWIDPAGAVVLSVIISINWLRTAFKEFLLLVGVSASVEMQQLITYICLTHDESIRGIDTVRCYHSGPRLIAEVDVVMDPEATLAFTHNVAEELQMKLESLPDVERAYVHVDFETTHKPEHMWRKDL